MRVIVFSSQKGGSGKTTLCGQLAVQAELSGDGPVAIIDTDPQGSLAQWWNARSSDTPLFLRVSGKYLHEDIRQLDRAGVRYVFVDTPPAVTDMISRIVAYADLVVVPTRPSPHDLRAVGATLDIIEAQRKQLVFAINAANRRARITGETAVALSQHGTVAPVTLHHRIDFATSMIHGETVMETDPESRSAMEIREMWGYLSSRLNESMPRVTRGTGIFQQAPKPRGFGLRKPQQAPAIA
ncbi:MAG: ParA family protein, partial [Rhodospirillales bacterium]|nr:ParA family protein [Rhodospirillales bacterium]